MDNIRKGLKPKIVKEIEEMRSKHEMEMSSPQNSNSLKNKHVVISENKCKLYETNNDLTLDDDLDELVLIAGL
uniref:Uncharacterized protein n=1 Tax=Ascaris lumbricoides TaxID=6252 RepID=A0A0M3IJK8_ASCLU